MTKKSIENTLLLTCYDANRLNVCVCVSASVHTQLMSKRPTVDYKRCQMTATQFDTESQNASVLVPKR